MPTLYIPRPARFAATGPTTPVFVRAATIGVTSTPADPWNDSGTFNAARSGETNLALLLLTLAFDNNGTTAHSIDTMTVGGNASTVGKAPINGSGVDSFTIGLNYFLDPPDNGSLAIAWSIDAATSLGVTAAAIVGLLFQNVNQSTPIGTNFNHVSNAASTTDMDLAITTIAANSMLVGGFMSRGAGTAHATSGGSTVPIAADTTGGSPTLDIEYSAAYLAAPTVGSNTLGVDITHVNTGRGGLVFELRGA